MSDCDRRKVATIRSGHDLLKMICALRDERQITHETMDDITELADGHTSKLLAPFPTKNLGLKSLGAFLGLFNLELEAYERADRPAPELEQRKRPKRRALV